MPPGPSAYFDIDDTLIMWKAPNVCERHYESDELITVNTRGIEETFVVNKHNLEYLRKLAVRGHAIIVWSAGGADWAESVVKALNIEDLVFAVMSKPTYFVDDVRDPKEFMGKHVYHDLEGNRVGFAPTSLLTEK